MVTPPDRSQAVPLRAKLVLVGSRAVSRLSLSPSPQTLIETDPVLFSGPGSIPFFSFRLVVPSFGLLFFFL
jgi:hypothetical protein